jgi:hypothetical protein
MATIVIFLIRIHRNAKVDQQVYLRCLLLDLLDRLDGKQNELQIGWKNNFYEQTRNEFSKFEFWAFSKYLQ